MTPEERKLVTELFDRLATLEDAARDPDAERAINDGLRQAPNAVYALVQTALVQDEALKRADARIRELEDELGLGPEPQRPAGFLDNVRGALFGTPEPRASVPRSGSVPTVRSSETSTGFRAGAQPMSEPYGRPYAQPAGQGGSFLGTAAAAAAGVIGGSLLLGGIRSMMGQHGSAHAAVDPSLGAQRDLTTPWSNTDGGDLARQAGIDSIGRSPPQTDTGGDDGGYGLFGNPADDDSDLDDFDDDGDLGFDGD
jgi:hypothetical protein